MFSSRANDDISIDDQMEESQKLYHQLNSKFNDKKMCFWLTMKLEEKISMILHQKNYTQFSFMLILLTEQHDPVLKHLKKTDKQLEYLINNLIYEKYIGLCQLKAFIAREMSMDKR